MNKLRLLLVIVATHFAAANGRAEVITVITRGIVESNVIQGNMIGVMPGDPVVMSFNVNSNVFLNNPNFPTRGYPIDLASWTMTVGGRPVPIVDPQPAGQTAYFVMRNNDPAVDGFFVSPGLDFDSPIAVSIPGLVPVHELNFKVTFNDGNEFPSLDILQALGTYDTSNISVYNWSIGRFGNPGALYTYETITLSQVPEPGSLSLLGLASVALVTRIRRKSVRRLP